DDTQTTPKVTEPTGDKQTTAKAYNPNLNPHRDEYYTQTTPKAVPAATARGGGEGTSPKTGASDVLPIAGAAAAVAVLGGVALVTKKKND
ncbi:MAG: LPXTG cell wall anchor domain-containing protein, partial [Oscillospiraceae bacterium]|nr:LPXTG cell wall anchor domain-containing protein [Oscillospiraceae bacterium]